ncbi:type II secretion system F family protein [Fodinisporobacter ferrooxydans]|uniref:Type II secretion system F family protein n=1 Tax=Fodinisporobacter ferrooxydans TaxID=2901836 RepID=A0ABY4CI84_9BACL|nr:type II secretion system F family protein [Alicyclobacillaceae bacterium MYW30-H2]
MLREQGKQVILEVQEVKETIWNKDIELRSNKVKAKDFVVFCRQFATLIRASVPIVDSLVILKEQTESKALKKALEVVTEEVAEGRQLSQCLAGQGKTFPTIFINLVRAGEMSGTLDDVLDRLAIYMEKQQNTTEKIKGALTYPLVLMVMSIGVAIFLLVKVIPTFVNIFHSQHLTLPLATRIVLAVSAFFIDRWYVLVLLLIACICGFLYVTRSQRGHFLLDYAKLKLPIFGKMFQKAVIARAMRTLATLFKSAVPTLQALQITSRVVENDVIGELLLEARESVRNGASLVQPFRNHWAIPPLVAQMISIGEQTGTIDEMFAKIADFYEADVEAMVEKLRPLIEPLMIVFMTAIVGVIVLAAILPMFSLYQNMGSMQ